MTSSEEKGSRMWGEGASDLWGRREDAEDERELELLDEVWALLYGSAGVVVEDEPSLSDPEAA